jgi:DNA-binding response OmpR family regulator
MQPPREASQRQAFDTPEDRYVLVVAADAAILMGLSEALSAAGHAVGAVQTVAAALAAIRLAAPSIVLFGLPLATAQSREELRELEGATDARVVYMDPAASPEDTLAETERLLALLRRTDTARIAA